MTPQAAAHQLLTLIFRTVFYDTTVIADPSGSPLVDEQKAAFVHLKEETRQACGYSVHDVDLDPLYDAVLASVPEEYRDALDAALATYDNARIADTVVRQEVYYRLGLELRGLMSERGARLLETI